MTFLNLLFMLRGDLLFLSFLFYFFLILSKFLSFLSIFSIFLIEALTSKTKLGSDTTCGAPHPDLSDTAVPGYGHARRHRLKPRGRETNPGPPMVLSMFLIIF